jgi:hypothetical protein
LRAPRQIRARRLAIPLSDKIAAPTTP